MTMTRKASSTSPGDRLFRAAMSFPMLDRQHELDLARRWREAGDTAALDELVSAYLRLVISIARRYKAYGLPISDLIQEGTLGLMRAAERFEPAREVRFSTYAGWWIRSAIQDFVLRNWSIVRTGTTAAQKSLFFKFRKLKAQINGHPLDSLRPEGRARVARILGVRLCDVETMEARLARGDQSLNAPISEQGERQWQDTLVDPCPSPEDAAIASIDGQRWRRRLNRALRQLSTRERLIIRMRRLGGETVTLSTLGARLGISKERVRQIEQQALGKLRDLLKPDGRHHWPPPFEVSSG